MVTGHAEPNLTALQQLIAEDLLASGGPAGRTTTRDQLLSEAKTFFGEATRIDTWPVEAMSCLELGTVAVCAYDWAERGQYAGQAFELSGTATDVLVRRDSGWVHQAHHVTLQHPQAMS